jgi:hypothetical protein
MKQGVLAEVANEETPEGTPGIVVATETIRES